MSLVTYKYTAVSKSGKRVNGVIDAYNEMEAVDRIRETCDIVLKITPTADKEGGFLSKDIGGTKLDMKAFTLMCNQFAIIIKAGIPIARTVQLIAAKTTDKNIKRILNQVATDVESGRSISASFEERGGKLLPTTLSRPSAPAKSPAAWTLPFSPSATILTNRPRCAPKCAALCPTQSLF